MSSSVIKGFNLNYEPDNPLVVGCDPEKEILKANEKELNARTQAELRIQEDSLVDRLEKLSNDIADAEEKYNDVVNETSRMIFETNKKVDKLLEDAKQEGIRRGMSEGKKKLELQLEEYKKEIDNNFDAKVIALEEEKKGFLIDCKEKLKDIITDSFIRIFENEAKNSKQLLNILILKGLRELTDEKEVRIILSENDYKNFDKDSFMSCLTGEYDDKQLSFTFDKNLADSSCQIETSLGFLDASVSNLASTVSELITNHIEEN